MARGLLTGTITVTIVSLICSIFSALFPAWLVDRKERESTFCWVGDGIWFIEYGWGKDIVPYFFECSKSSVHKGPFNSYDAYCLNKISDKGEPENYNDIMCTRTTYAKIFSTMENSFIVISLAVMFTSLVKRKYEYYLSIASFLLTAGAFIMHLLCFLAMVTSPLFSQEHYDFLSKHHHGPKYNGFDCSFESPIGNLPFSLLDSSSLNCLFPGPAFLASFAAIITLSFSTVIQILWVFDAYKLRHPTMLFYSKKDLMDHPEIHTRVYSLYGASSRRFSHLSWIKRHFIITVIPTLLILLSALLWGLFIESGIAVVLHARIQLVPYHLPHSSSLSQFLGDENVNFAADHRNETLILQKYFNYHGISFPFTHFNEVPSEDELGFEPMIIREVMKVAKEVSKLPEKNTTNGKSYPRHMTFFHNTYNLFDFSPITMTTFFTRGDAYLIAFACAFGMLIWPVILCIVVLGFYWIPFSEVFRGRVLTFADTIGKAQLAIFYALLAVGIGDDISRQIHLPWFLFFGLLKPGEALVLEIFVKLTSGLGSWTFVFACVSFLLVGNFTLRLHRYSRTWEENRRAEVAAKETARILQALENNDAFSPSIQHYNLDGGHDLDENDVLSVGGDGHYFGRRDTPFFDSLAWSGAITPFISGTMMLPPTQSSKIDSGSIGSNSSKNTPMLQESVFSASQTPLLLTEHNRILDSQRQIRSGSFLGGNVSNSGKSSSTPMPNRIMVMDAGGNLIHPNTEALCDRVFHPLPGRRMRWSSIGKTFVYIVIFTTISATMITLSIDVLHVTYDSFVADFIILPRDRDVPYSILSITQQLVETSYPEKSYHLAAVYFFFTVVMNVMHVVGLALMWAIPMSLKNQKNAFHLLEIFAAWSSVDIFCVMLIIFAIEVKRFPNGLFNLILPKVAKIMTFFLPWETGFIHISMPLTPNFGALVTVVIFEKILSFFIMEQAAQMISERDVLERYSEGKLTWNRDVMMRKESIVNPLNTLAQSIKKSGSLPSHLGASIDGGSGSTSAISHHQNLRRPAKQQQNSHVRGDILYQAFSPLLYTSLINERIDENNDFYQQQHQHRTGSPDLTIEAPKSAIDFDDLTERLFETEVGALFSPAARYASALVPKYMYAGFPRSFWSFGERIGLFEAVFIAPDDEQEEIDGNSHQDQINQEKNSSSIKQQKTENDVGKNNINEDNDKEEITEGNIPITQSSVISTESTLPLSPHGSAFVKDVNAIGASSFDSQFKLE